MKRTVQLIVLIAVASTTLMLPSVPSPWADESLPAPPPGFEEITGTPVGFAVADEVAVRARSQGLDRDKDDYRVLRSSLLESEGSVDDVTIVVMHPALELGALIEVETPVGAQVDALVTISDESVLAAEGFSASPDANSSAEAQTGSGSTTENGTGTRSNCYDMEVNNSRVWQRSCWHVKNMGYSNNYYYFMIEQSQFAYGKKSNERLVGMSMRNTRHYGTTWAAPDPIDPAITVTNNCSSYPLSVTGGPFSFGTSVNFCETSRPMWDDYYYQLSWNGSVKAYENRQIRYLNMQRRYRNSSWKYTFRASSWTRA